MKRSNYLILIATLSFASSFSMDPVVDLTDPNLMDHPGQEYAMKKSGVTRILKRWKYDVIKLDNDLRILRDNYDNRIITKDQYTNLHRIIMGKIIARQNVAANKIAQVVGHPIVFNELMRIDAVKNADLDGIAEQLL